MLKSAGTPFVSASTPSRRFALVSSLSAVLLGLLGEWNAFAQTQAAADTIVHVHGTVVDSRTGKGIARALVQSTDRRLAILTGNSGQFALDVHVPPQTGTGTSAGPAAFVAGQPFFLFAQRPGYASNDGPRSIPLNGSSDPAEVTLQLQPQATLAGRVFAAGSDTAQGVKVTLMRRQTTAGERTWVQVSVATVNSRGEFRFGELQPGEYTVFTNEWRGEDWQPPGPDGITHEYPPAFLGDRSGFESSSKLTVHGGDTARAELHIAPATYYEVKVPVPLSLAQNTGYGIRVQGGGSWQAFTLGYDQREHAVEGSLPTGTYTLLVTQYGPQPASALLQLTVADQPLHTGPITLTPSPSIPVRLHAQISRGATALPIVELDLVPLEPGFGDYSHAQNMPGSHDTFTLENVQPGRYRLEAHANPGYVSAITGGGVDLLQEPLVIGSNGSIGPIDLTVRDDTGSVQVTVATGTALAPERCFVVLLPVTSTASYLTSFVGPDLKTTLGEVAPGEYRAFAVPRMMADLPYRDPEAMQRFAGKGATITVKGADTQSLTVPLLTEEELKED